jgi:hypothetical protein
VAQPIKEFRTFYRIEALVLVSVQRIPTGQYPEPHEPVRNLIPFLTSILNIISHLRQGLTSNHFHSRSFITTVDEFLIRNSNISK